METAQAFKWVLDTAKADAPLVAVATGGFYEGFAPQGTAMPYFLVTAQDPGSDVLSGNRTRLMTHILLQIKVVGLAASYNSLVTGADRIDALFGDMKNVALSPGSMIACWRENEIAYPDPKLIDGKQVRHLGGLYHIELKGA